MCVKRAIIFTLGKNMIRLNYTENSKGLPDLGRS